MTTHWCCALPATLLAAALGCSGSQHRASAGQAPPPEFLDAEAFDLLVPKAAKEALGLGALPATVPIQAPRGARTSEKLRQMVDAAVACVQHGPLWIAIRFGPDGHPQPATVALPRGGIPSCALDGLTPVDERWGTGEEGVVVVQVFGVASMVMAALPEASHPPESCCWKPRTAKPCSVSSISLPQGVFRANAGTTHTAVFAVRADGTVGDFYMVSPTEARVGVAIARAIRRCAWIPGRCGSRSCSDPGAQDAATPTMMWQILPIHFQ